MPSRKRSWSEVFQSSITILFVIYITVCTTLHVVVDDDDDDDDEFTTPSATPSIDNTTGNRTKKDKQLGPYRFLHIENNRIHLAGILGLKDANKLARGGVQAEIETIFTNMKNLLEGYDGTSLEKVIWIKFLLVNVSESSVIENSFHKYFKPPYPNKTIIPVERLKFNARVEAELFASLNYTKKMDVELY